MNESPTPRYPSSCRVVILARYRPRNWADRRDAREERQTYQWISSSRQSRREPRDVCHRRVHRATAGIHRLGVLRLTSMSKFGEVVGITPFLNFITLPTTQSSPPFLFCIHPQLLFPIRLHSLHIISYPPFSSAVLTRQLNWIIESVV